MHTVCFNADLCVMTKFSALIAGKWKPILLYLVQHGINRFNLMHGYMPTISKKVLTEQLRELEADGLLRREELKAKAPKVVVYHLTEKGASLRLLIDEIISWCMEHMKDELPQELLAIFRQSPPAFVQAQ